MSENNSYIIVTHTDMDGVGSAALYIYLHGKQPEKIYFTEPYLLYKTLQKIAGSDYEVRKIALMDLGMNKETMDKIMEYIRIIRGKNIDIEWFDHHVWDEDWINKLRGLGVKIYIDRSTCAVGVVAKYAEKYRNNIDEEFVSELVKGVCAGDLWRFDHWRGPWYLRLVRRHDDPEWRLKVLEKISSGVLWDDEFTDKVVERFEKELIGYKMVDKTILTREINNIRIAVVLQNKYIENSFTASYTMGRTNADIVAVISKDGKVSLRSRNINIRNLALAFGGGGHPRAAGFKIKIPLIIRLKSLLKNKALQEYIISKLTEKIRNIGIEHIE
ncbi:DHH family phosphoesterase [Staphylothermus hellenicus]|uniref:Phosphoesterase DHHA1 n=1 Tax=Staphylothermus hellenicus (strain DSM 12710 / JCM 10830 / BK20S6-10-b1 / P8) TaxID=591019 RepID=D7D8J5_STAHD|nr:DHHA1 domain-containing protein [Staphylothermus hellenicus]ADI32091.1 phosphoesterase DHHA1 [Staphylothermus hellenicus DSM 12710]